MVGVKTLLFSSLVLIASFASAGTKEEIHHEKKVEHHENRHHENEREHEHEREEHNQTWRFTVSKTLGNAPLVVTFDASKIKPAKKFYWSFGNGDKLVSDKSIVSYQYKVAGTYTASLKFAVNASDKELKNLKDAGSVVIKVLNDNPPVNQPPVASLSCSVNNLLVACSGIASYDPENQPLTFAFNYSDGFSETNTTGLSSHAYSIPGLYNVQLSVVDSAGAAAVATIPVQAVKPPNKLPVLALNCASDVINTLSCDANGSTDADGNIVSYSYAWDDNASVTKADSSAVTHVFSTSGTHSVTLSAVDNDGGVSTLTKSFSVKANANPIAAFTCDNSKPLLLNCSSTSTDPDAGDSIQNYSWKFGTASAFITTTNSTNYTFSAGGDVEVTLLVTDSYGGTNSITKTITVKENQLPTFDFNADVVTGFAPLKVHFQILNAQDVDGSVASYDLNFGDQATSGSNDVVHTFNAPGTYNVVASVTDDYGGTTTKTKQIVVNALINNPPQANFKIFEYDTQVELHATVIKTQYDIKRAYYTTDDGQTVELSEFYPNTINWIDLKNLGQHEITLTVEDIYGQKSSFTHNFDLSANLDDLKPYTDFTVKQSAVRTAFINLNRSFDFDADQSIQSFHVDFGNGESLDTTDLYVTHTYPYSGTYPITVTATTDHKTSSSRTREITLTDDVTPILQPVANFGYRIYDFAQNVSFYNDRSGTPNGSIISYIWDFGDGTSGTGTKASHFYNPGSYLVTLTVVDSAGLQSTQTQHVTIFGTGTDLIAQINCDIAQPYFDFTQSCQIFALDKLNQISRVRVSWGDGGANNLTLPSPNGIFKPSHKYAGAGNFPVTLTVTTSRGEVKSAATSIALTKYTPVVATIQCFTNNLLVTCNALGSYDIYASALTYTFDYGDSFIDTNTNGISSHAFSVAGLYSVKVTVKNPNGESAVAQTQVNPLLPINHAPIANLNCFSSEPYILRCGPEGSYDEDGTIVSYKYLWDDGTVETYSANSNVFHVFKTGGSHQITLTVTDNDGATKEFAASFDVKQNHSPVANFSCYSSMPQTIHCDSYSYDEDPGDVITEYKWDLGDGNIVTSFIPSIDYNYADAYTYTISLQVKDVMGALGSTSLDVHPLENFAPTANINCNVTTGTTYQCDSNAFDSDGSVAQILWTIDGQSFSGPNALYEFTNGGDKIISLKVTDNLGKSAVLEQILHIDKPIIGFNCSVPSPLHIKCDYVQNSADNKKVVQYRYTIDDKDLFLTQGFEYDFLLSGAHKISLDVIADDGTVSTLIKNLNIEPAHLAPKAIFKSFMDVSLNVNFNASESFLQERKVLKFTWDFGDGSSASSLEGVISHRFSVIGNYKVTLTVIDDLEESNVYSTDVFVYDSEVADPGPANDETIEGLDLDGDGVRDDIQRWINFEAKDNLVLKALLRKLAFKYINQISKIDDPSVTQILETEKNKIQICLLGTLDNDSRAQKIDQVFTYLFSNTELRSKAWSAVLGNLSGASYLTPPSNSGERLKYCEGIQ